MTKQKTEKKHKRPGCLKTAWGHRWLAHKSHQRPKAAKPSTALYNIWGALEECPCRPWSAGRSGRIAVLLCGCWDLVMSESRTKHQKRLPTVVPKRRSRGLRLRATSKWRDTHRLGVSATDHARHYHRKKLLFWKPVTRFLMIKFNRRNFPKLSRPRHYTTYLLRLAVLARISARGRVARLMSSEQCYSTYCCVLLSFTARCALRAAPACS